MDRLETVESVPLLSLDEFDNHLDELRGSEDFTHLHHIFYEDILEEQAPMTLRMYTLSDLLTDNEADKFGALDAYVFMVAYHNTVKGDAPEVSQTAINDLTKLRNTDQYDISELQDIRDMTRNDPGLATRFYSMLEQNHALTDQGRYAAMQILLETRALFAKQTAYNLRAK